MTMLNSNFAGLIDKELKRVFAKHERKLDKACILFLNKNNIYLFTGKGKPKPLGRKIKKQD